METARVAIDVKCSSEDDRKEMQLLPMPNLVLGESRYADVTASAGNKTFQFVTYEP